MANCIKCGRNLPSLTFGKKICGWCVQHEAAQRGELPDDAVQPVMTVPWAKRSTNQTVVTHALVGINAAVFLGMALAGISITSPTTQQLVHWGANWGPLTLSGEWWRLFTCMFLHIGVIHIAFNMWCLWDLGALAESLYGNWTFASVYLISGVAGSVASVAWHPGTVSAGASGAIFGIAGALIASFYLGEFSLPRAAIQPSLRSVVMFAGYNLLFGAISGRTDNAAHIGGLVCGLALGALIAKAAPNQDDPPRRILVIGLVLGVVLGSASWTQSARGYIMHTQRASVLLQQNKVAAAISELQTAVRQKPAYIPAHLELAYAYAKNSQADQAEAQLKQVIALDSKNDEAYYQLGRLYADHNRLTDARSAFNQVLALDGENAGTHFGLGYVAAAEHNHPLAVEEYRRAVQLDPEFEDAYYNMGLSFTELHQYDNSIAAFLKERELSGDSADLESQLAKAYAAKGMKAEAAEATQKAAGLQHSK
jgi:membrane associated rhomboid family serine protease/Tfp pilus assembly protein PilF